MDLHLNYINKLLPDLKLMDHQKQLLTEDNNRIVIKKGRGTGISMCIVLKALAFAYYNTNTFQVILVPHNAQKGMYVDQIQRFTSCEKVNKDTITLHGNCIIKIMCEGDFKGRGSLIDALYIDEANYIDDEVIAVAMSMLNTQKHHVVWIASTPKDNDGFFWSMYNVDNGYKKFHFPATLTPYFNEDNAIYFQKIFSAKEYTREILAEFC